MASGLPPCAFECGSLDQRPWLSVAQPRSSLRFNTEAASERLHHRRKRRADWPVWSIGHRRSESSQHSPAMGKAETFPGDPVTRPAGIRAEWGLGPHHRFDLQLWLMSGTLGQPYCPERHYRRREICNTRYGSIQNWKPRAAAGEHIRGTQERSNKRYHPRLLSFAKRETGGRIWVDAVPFVVIAPSRKATSINDFVCSGQSRSASVISANQLGSIASSRS